MSYIHQGNKNLMINGNFDVWQRGTSWVAPASNTPTADRFAYWKVGAMVHTVAQSSDVPTPAESGVKSNYSYHLTLTTPDNSIAAGDYTALLYSVEGYDFARIAQKPMVFSFWVKATTTGIYCVSFRNASPSDRSWVSEYTINSANTWEKKVIKIDASPSAGNWDYTDGVGLRVVFSLAAGTNFQTTADAWQTGLFFCTSNGVNGVATGSTNFRIAQVQLEEGDVATDFELKEFNDELKGCQRYFEKNFDLTTAPADLNTNTARPGNGAASTNTKISIPIIYKVRKRSAPTITFYSDSGNTGRWDYYDTAWQTNKIMAASKESESDFTAQITTAGIVANESFVSRGFWTADAEL